MPRDVLSIEAITVEKLYHAAAALLDALDMPATTVEEHKEKFNRIFYCRAQLRNLLAAIDFLTGFTVYRGPGM